MCLTASQCLPEHEDHVMGVEGAAYRVAVPTGAGKLHNGQVCFKYTSCVSVELRFLPAVMEVIKVTLTLLKTYHIMSLQLALQVMSLRYL